MTRACVVGAGPNGLAAAITMASAGVAVDVFEANSTLGGGCRTEEPTIAGFLHDTGSSVYPMGSASPFFGMLPLARYGLRWIEPTAPLAHPLDDGTAVMLEHDLASTCENLDRSDRSAWHSLFKPFVDDWPALLREILGPIQHVPRSPILLARFGLYALLPATTLARSAFKGSRARALFAGMAAHSVRPLTSPVSAAVGLVLGTAAHTTGWPIVEGGAQQLTDALVAHLRSLGGVVHPGHRVESLSEIAEYESALLDLTPKQFVTLAASQLTKQATKRYARYQYGPGAFKVDWALSQPIPWKAAECLRAGTVHVGGTLEAIAEAEAAPWHGANSKQPFVLLVQPSLFDPFRAPAGKHTAWGYCHVQNGSEEDMLHAIEAQVERFAPGFRECILARHVMRPAALEAWNANLVGGDLSGGAMTPWQMLMRPTPSLYRTPIDEVYLCSSSTPPGGGVHGMCGYLAAQQALRALNRSLSPQWERG